MSPTRSLRTKKYIKRKQEHTKESNKQTNIVACGFNMIFTPNKTREKKTTNTQELKKQAFKWSEMEEFPKNKNAQGIVEGTSQIKYPKTSMWKLSVILI